MPDYRRLPLGGPKPAGDWRVRLGRAVVWIAATVLTIGLLIAAFFVGLVVLGLLVLFGLGMWARNKWRGGAPRPSSFRARTGRAPVVIEGEFVVLSGRSSPRPAPEIRPQD